MIHGSCMIAVSRLRGKSWYFSPAAIAEVARDLPTFSEKVLPHIFLVGSFPVRVDGVHGRTMLSPKEPVAQLKNTWGVLLFPHHGDTSYSHSVTMFISGVLHGSVSGLEHSVALGCCTGTVFGHSDVR